MSLAVAAPAVLRYGELRFHALQLRKLEQAKVKLELQRDAIERAGLATEVIAAPIAGAIQMLASRVDEMKAGLSGFAADSRFWDWIQGAKGLGPAVLFAVGQMPPLSPDWIPDPLGRDDEGGPNYMTGVRACWKYAGLHVVDGAAPQRTRGTFSGWDAYLKSLWIYRVAVTVEKQSKDDPPPYRALYDDRKARTLDDHPPMRPVGECESCDEARRATQIQRAGKNQVRERQALARDCSHFGGPHWTDGHRRADALRITAKAVLKDAWLVANGKLPAVGIAYE